MHTLSRSHMYGHLEILKRKWKHDSLKAGVYLVRTGCTVIDVLEAGGRERNRPSHEAWQPRRSGDAVTRVPESGHRGKRAFSETGKQRKCKAPQQKEAGVVPKNTITSAQNDEGEGADGPITKE